MASDQVTRSDDTAASAPHNSTLTSPGLHEKPSVSRSEGTVLDESLIDGGFHLRIDGNCSESFRSKVPKKLCLDFRGKWEPKLQWTHSTNIAGTVMVEGLTDKPTAMHGTLTAKLPKGPFNLCFDFFDARGEQHSINASMLSTSNSYANGQLKRGNEIIGTVELEVSWKLVKNGLISLLPAARLSR